MNWLIKAIGQCIYWMVAGAVLGLVASVFIGVVLVVQLTLESGRSPGSDPMVPFVLMWVFMIGPGGTAGGAMVGFLAWIGKTVWQWLRDTYAIFTLTL